MLNFARRLICIKNGHIGLLYTVIFFALFFFLQNSAEACPCGCGATGPQVLYPGEEWKFFGATTRMSNFETIRDDGTAGSESGPDYRDTLTLAVARAITPGLSSTLTVLSHQNMRDGEDTRRSLGDPSLSIRYTVAPQNMASPWAPQIQIFMTYKHPVARSIYETRVPYQMDVFGNGTAELVPGADAWFGMEEWRIGVAEQFSVGKERILDGNIKLSPGLSNRLSILGGYTWLGQGALLLAADHEVQAPSFVDGVKTNQRGTNSLSLSGSYALAFRKTAGASVKRTAVGSNNRNTTASLSATISYLEAM